MDGFFGEFLGRFEILRIPVIPVKVFEKLMARSQPGWDPGEFY